MREPAFAGANHQAFIRGVRILLKDAIKIGLSTKTLVA